MRMIDVTGVLIFDPDRFTVTCYRSAERTDIPSTKAATTASCFSWLKMLLRESRGTVSSPSALDVPVGEPATVAPEKTLAGELGGDAVFCLSGRARRLARFLGRSDYVVMLPPRGFLAVPSRAADCPQSADPKEQRECVTSCNPPRPGCGPVWR